MSTLFHGLRHNHEMQQPQPNLLYVVLPLKTALHHEDLATVCLLSPPVIP
jgi:hypothetical protein